MNVLSELLKKINNAASTIEIFSSSAVMNGEYINEDYLNNILSSIDYLNELKAELLTIIENKESAE